MMNDYPDLALFVGGGWRGQEGRCSIPVINPASGETLGLLPAATAEDVEEALQAAADAFPAWAATSPYERSRLLLKVAERLRGEKERLALLITLELGKPLAESRTEVETAAGIWEWNAEEARRAYGRVIPARRPGVRQFVLREPLGPVAAFSSWNAPLITPSRKISGALAAGCPVIMKPAEETPATALALGRIVEEAGMPAGTLSLLFGDPARISERLLRSPVIRGMTFTGSSTVGRQLGKLALDGMKRMTLELGGHAPVLVFGDVDPESVVPGAVTAKFRNSGQVCTSPTRFYVHESIYARFVELFVARTRALVVGDGRDDPKTTMGPLANERRVQAMERLCADARDRGLPIPAGGRLVARPGYFWEPTVVTDATQDCLAANEEPFGPLALMTPFSTFEEAMALANRLPAGLAAYAFTRDVRTASDVGDAVQSGNVILNHWQASLPETPFGGVRDSGFGLEGGIEGLEAFQSVKYVSQG